jgi:hypothetical protein
MMTRWRLGTAAIAAGAAAWAAAVVNGALAASSQLPPASTASRVDFTRQIQPLLKAHCLECHSQDKRKGGLSVATLDDLLEGGKDGAVVRPGKSADSLMLQRLTGDIEPQMPKDEDPLAEAQMALIRQWIDEGARATPTSPPAPAPWEAPLTLERPALPEVVWPAWTRPVDRLVAAYMTAQGRRDAPVSEPRLVSDARFARRAYLDVWGLPPTPEELQRFVADPSPAKRDALVTRLLADPEKYADHWISFWNDLLRNEDGVTYFSETAGRKSISDWLLPALRSNLAYDRFVGKLLNPSEPGDPEGFLVGVNWRGETSAAVTPWMQASQNTAQVFLGVNLKCASCHDSFVNKWKLRDAYGLAAYFAPEPKLQLYRCDVAQERYAEPGFLFKDLARTPRSSALADRRAAAAEIFLDKRLGRLPRTFVNRIWQRLLGHGIVANPDEMDGEPWSPALLDWLASDFVEHGYDIRHLLQTILTSRAYQLPAIARTGEVQARGYVFTGPEVRRLTAEQFADTVGAMTGEWNVAPARGGPGAPPSRPEAEGAPLPSQPTVSGVYAREWRVASSDLTRALGRPVRDQITSTRPSMATTLQALELVNGELLTVRLSRGARRMLGRLPSEPVSLYNRAVAGRHAASSRFDVDISKARRLWLVVEEAGSNVPNAITPVWAEAELVGPTGATPLASLKPIDPSGLRTAPGPIQVSGSTPGERSRGGVRVKNPSVVVYDVAGRGFTSLRGVIGIENAASDIGATVNPQLRFYVFDVEPDLERLVPAKPGAPLPSAPPLTTVTEVVDRAFWHALGRAPVAAERRAAAAALRDPARPGRLSAEGLADLLWALTMKPEFQLIY